MSEPTITATAYRKNKSVPLTVSFGNGNRYGLPNVIREVVRFREKDDEWSPPEGRHFLSAQLAIPTSTGYDNDAEDFTYGVLLSINDPQVARRLADEFLRIAEKLEIPYQACRGCLDAYPAPCLECAMADAGLYSDDEAKV